ncbi:hypothetical protein GPECTOR_873g117 [Gonium pectorale]|uniref:Uncharacterized protein n=1 Tax=Gonium pectorale TaxID=33097 RepID=A0A150FTW3_GONPE|nr:hypothetical protein GPECTOR_873g117 [Gonium pectorale]|eukprot:KXZ41063.1 hypothetical protein GPECTOR_873g117 [Gonium pectorale]
MDPAQRSGEQLYRSATALVGWPDHQPLLLAVLGADSFLATLLGGFVFDIERLLVRCVCSSCAGLPPLVGDEVEDEQTCVMTLIRYALHALNPPLVAEGGAETALEVAEAALEAAGLGPDDTSAALFGLIPDLLFVKQVPAGPASVAAKEAGAAVAAAAGPEGAGHAAAPAPAATSPGGGGARGVLPLSEFLRQSAEAAGGASLVGRRVWVHVFTLAGLREEAAAPAAGGAGAGAAEPAAEAEAAERRRDSEPGSGSGTGSGQEPDLDPASWFRGRLVGYDPETGVHRVEYDPGQPLERWQPPGEDHSPLHLATCHVRLGQEPGPGGRRRWPRGAGGAPGWRQEQEEEEMAQQEEQQEEDGDGGGPELGPGSRSWLAGPFVGCLPLTS